MSSSMEFASSGKLGPTLSESQEPVAVHDQYSGRKGSLIAKEYHEGKRSKVPPPEQVPTNEEVAKAVQQKVAAAIEMSRKYRHVAWYSLFVAAYMVVLYFQANAYSSGDVVKTLNAQFSVDGETSFSFQSEDQVLAYLGNQVLLPIWQDPICGDGNCEYPWEFPAWGRFGCESDCGLNSNVTQVVVNVQADFTGHPTISARVLMNNAVWNLCLADEMRRARGEADLCWYEADQVFDNVQVNSINNMGVIDGSWYVQVKGDYAGRVSGRIFDITNSSAPLELSTSPAWTSCKLVSASTNINPTQTALRRLLQAYTEAHKAGGDEAKGILQQAVDEIAAMPEMRKINFTKITEAANVATRQNGGHELRAPESAAAPADAK